MIDRAQAEADIIQLHWIGDECVGLNELASVSKPVFWRVADMWPFCGGEHYADDLPTAGWRNGYGARSRWDPDRLVWRRKKEISRAFKFVATSNYVATCVRESALYSGQEIRVIPNPIDVGLFKPTERGFARSKLGLPQDREIVMFGALGGIADKRKGWHLLHAALLKMQSERPKMICAIFGQDRPAQFDSGLKEVHFLGHIRDNTSLAMAYSAADVMAVPSLSETFGQTASEAQACGTPVAAFAVGGLNDTVVDGVTGRKAKPFDIEEYRLALDWCLDRSYSIRAHIRDDAVNRFSLGAIGAKYQQYYRDALGND
jgi:glycosyltransferase involved in cell wall biosynthesis